MFERDEDEQLPAVHSRSEVEVGLGWFMIRARTAHSSGLLRGTEPSHESWLHRVVSHTRIM